MVFFSARSQKIPDLKSVLGFCIFVEMKVIMPITSLDQLDLNATYTYADYLQWQLKERLELLRGKIALMSPAPSRKHQQILVNLLLQIGNYLDGKSCFVYCAPFDVRLPINRGDSTEYSVVQPDLCVVCDEDKLDGKGCTGAPDLVVEILSPGNTKKEMKDKFNLYEEAGVQEYWIVDPERLHMLIFELNDQGKYIGKPPITKGDQLETPILPNLVIEADKIFEKV